jgi:hypothetical protein
LRGSDFFLKFLLLAANLNGEFLYLKIEFSNLGIVLLAVLLESDVVLLLLLASDGPLLQFFLVPVELQLDLFHLLVDTEDTHLDVVEAFLVVYDILVEFFYLVLQTPALPFSHLPQVILCLGFLVLRVDQGLRVEQFLVNVLEVLFQNLLSLEIFVVLLVHLLNMAFLLANLS